MPTLRDMQILRLPHSDISNFSDLIRLFADVFGMQNFKVPPRDHLQELMGNKNLIVFVAIENNKVVGGLTAYTLQQYYSTRPLAYLYDLAIAVEYQRQGIGRKLISALSAYCKTEGYEEIFVQADKSDQHALDFYRSSGVTGESEVIQFCYKLK
jgi:aminoglycoside 3-N-acetyltransferase I